MNYETKNAICDAIKTIFSKITDDPTSIKKLNLVLDDFTNDSAFTFFVSRLAYCDEKIIPPMIQARYNKELTDIDYQQGIAILNEAVSIDCGNSPIHYMRRWLDEISPDLVSFLKKTIIDTDDMLNDSGVALINSWNPNTQKHNIQYHPV